MENGKWKMENDCFFVKKRKNICVYQKKAVLLHPLFV